MLEYKKPYSHRLFIVAMPEAILFVFWVYSLINPAQLYTVKALGALGLIPFALGALIMGPTKITFDGKTLRISYQLWKTRTHAREEITKITQHRTLGDGATVTLCFYLKNGEKFSRGITGKQVYEFADALCAQFT